MKGLERVISVIICICIILSVCFVGATAAETVRPYGDVNNDQKVNSADALEILMIATGQKSASDTTFTYGDCNRDGRLNATDALLILRFAVGNTIPLTSFGFDYSERAAIIGSSFQQIVTYFRPIVADYGRLIWTSSNPSVATISESGYVKTISLGSTIITCTSPDNSELSSSYTLIVKDHVSSVSLNENNLTIEQGSSVELSASVAPADAYNKTLYWYSGDSSVASVDENGKVTAKKIGVTRIYAHSTDGSGKFDSCIIKVTAMTIPYVNQLPSYPTGCEAASSCMLLKYYGFSITLDQMISLIPRKNLYKKDGKIYGPDINEMFVGDPRYTYTSSTPGYGVFSPAVTKALQKAIDQHSGNYTAVKISGCSFNELLQKVSMGHPAIVWATYKMKKPTTVNAWYIESTGKYFEYPRGTHVMILSGYGNGKVVTVDPYKNGVLEFDMDLFEDRWELLNRQAIILQKK